MNRKLKRSDISKTTSRRICLLIFVISIMTAFNGCFLKQDRTTTVYGTITDHNGQPVDSIMVLVSGLEFYHGTTLREIYSDSAGEYEVVVETPRKYNVLNVIIPSFSSTNAKFQNNYDGYNVKKMTR